jgi:hypothetical protein
MKALHDKVLLESYARQVALVDLQAREQRLKQQLALLSKNFVAFETQSASRSPHAAAASSSSAAGEHAVADVPRCIEGIKMLQAKSHGGANEEVLISQLGTVVIPKVFFTRSLHSTLSRVPSRGIFVSAFLQALTNPRSGRRPWQVPPIPPAGDKQPFPLFHPSPADHPPQHFEVIFRDGPSPKAKGTISAVKLR